jgi:hypothetical protein
MKYNQIDPKMIPDYTFNPDLQRFETSNQTCEYCSKNTTQGDETNHYQSLYLEKKRLNLFVYRSVKYSTFSICIPRCKRCKTIHSNTESNSSKWAWFLGIVIFIFLNMYVELSNFWSIVFSLISLAIIDKSLQKDLLKKHNILSPSDGAEKNQLVQEFIEDGWQIEKPNA